MTARFPWQSIDWSQPIVDPQTGRASEYFLRQLFNASQNGENTDNTLDVLAETIGGKADKTIQIIAGAGLTGGGTLEADRTLSLDTTAEAERIRDVIGAALVAGSNVTITVNDAGDTITIAASGGGGGGGAWTELIVTNPGAETGDLTGWTGTTFTASTANPSGHVVTPIKGSYSFVATATATAEIYQDISVSSYSTDIDAYSMQMLFTAFACDTFTTGERPYLRVEFYDGAGTPNLLAASWSTDGLVQNIGQGVWRPMQLVQLVPKNTRKIRIFIRSTRLDGTANNTAFDDVRVFVRKFV